MSRSRFSPRGHTIRVPKDVGTAEYGNGQKNDSGCKLPIYFRLYFHKKQFNRSCGGEPDSGRNWACVRCRTNLKLKKPPLESWGCAPIPGTANSGSVPWK